MTLKEFGIEHKIIDKILVGYTNFRGEIMDIQPKIEQFYEKIRDYASGPPIAVIDYGVYSEGGIDIDLCFPIKDKKGLESVQMKYLEPIEVLSIMHHGPDDTLKETFQILSKYTQEHVVLGTAWLRLVYHKYSQANPEDNQIEIQYNLHKWDDRLEKSIRRVLNEEIKNEIMKDRETLFSIESSYNDRILWLKEMLDRLDKVTNEDQKFEILSCCAHEFSKKRINYMKNIYEKTGDIDEVIKEMQKDYTWYENPVRKGNIIYVSKIPVNLEEYEKAQTIEEKKRNYCHCRFINENLDKGISPTFCYCGTGWYRQQWEGILEKPIKIEVLKSLLKGDDVCEVAIHLPSN
ncbi:MAG: hypothetical protein ACFE85_15760 [Candidatus Hodarchaeota archaeon]